MRSLLPAAALAFALAAGCSASVPPGDAAAGGPELRFTGLEWKEVRADGVRWRLSAERGGYFLSEKRLEGRDVRLTLPLAGGEARVEAPATAWEVGAKKAAFPEGCVATLSGGYSATVPRAQVDLDARSMSAPSARFAGPGFTVEGGEFSWRWKDGKADLSGPRSVISPRAVARKGG